MRKIVENEKKINDKILNEKSIKLKLKNNIKHLNFPHSISNITHL